MPEARGTARVALFLAGVILGVCFAEGFSKHHGWEYFGAGLLIILIGVSLGISDERQ